MDNVSFTNRMHLVQLEKLIQSNVLSRQDWKDISTYQVLSEDFINKYYTKLDWNRLSMYQNMSEIFITDCSNHVNWFYVFQFQNISDSCRKFYQEFCDIAEKKLTLEQWVEDVEEYFYIKMMGADSYKETVVGHDLPLGYIKGIEDHAWLFNNNLKQDNPKDIIKFLDHKTKKAQEKRARLQKMLDEVDQDLQKLDQNKTDIILDYGLYRPMSDLKQYAGKNLVSITLVDNDESPIGLFKLSRDLPPVFQPEYVEGVDDPLFRGFLRISKDGHIEGIDGRYREIKSDGGDSYFIDDDYATFYGFTDIHIQGEEPEKLEIK